MALFSKIFGSNEREIRKLQPIVDSINAFGKKISELSDEELKNKRKEFKNETINSIFLFFDVVM